MQCDKASLRPALRERRLKRHWKQSISSYIPTPAWNFAAHEDGDYGLKGVQGGVVWERVHKSGFEQRLTRGGDLRQKWAVGVGVGVGFIVIVTLLLGLLGSKVKKMYRKIGFEMGLWRKGVSLSC